MKLNGLSEEFLEELAEQLNISDAAFSSAERSYDAVSNLLQKKFKNCKIHVYPQGSMRLGTAIKPINENDDYDLDLVCEFLGDYFTSAKDLKKSVGSALAENEIYKKKLKEGKRCWKLEYADSANFHMDILPCKSSDKGDKSIDITNKVENEYEYKSSNPYKYGLWFDILQKGEIIRELKKRNIVLSEDCEIDDLKTYKIRTVLQKTIQILKRHRDVTYLNASEKELENKPISIIITTIVGKMYTGSETIADLIYKFITQIDKYLVVDSKGIYHVTNPVDEEENFADKWETHPSRKKAFFDWIYKLKKDLILSSNLLSEDKIVRLEHLKKIFGASVISDIVKKEHFENKNKDKINYVKPNQDNVVVFSKEQDKNSLKVKEHTFYD